VYKSVFVCLYVCFIPTVGIVAFGIYVDNFWRPMCPKKNHYERRDEIWAAVLQIRFPRCKISRFHELNSCEPVCCFVLLNRYWGIITVPEFPRASQGSTHLQLKIADVPTDDDDCLYNYE